MYITSTIVTEMDVENGNFAGSLLKTECYICMELCVTRSPCECKSYVHTHCLIKFIETSGKTHCTICTGQYPLSPPEPKNKCAEKIVCILFGSGLFFPFGWLGSCMLDDCPDYDPFSVNSCFSAIVCYFVLILFWACFVYGWRPR